MIKGLYMEKLTPSSKLNNTYICSSGETARGVRFIMRNFESYENLRFHNYIKINGEIYENENVIFDSSNKYLDIIFPPLNVGTYTSEISIMDSQRKLLSGIFCIKYIESLMTSESNKLKKIDASELLDKLIDTKNIVADLDEKTKNIKKVIDKNFEYSQMNASSEWTILHDLNKYPTVTIIDSAGNSLYADISYISKNKIVIRFSNPLSGFAILN